MHDHGTILKNLEPTGWRIHPTGKTLYYKPPSPYCAFVPAAPLAHYLDSRDEAIHRVKVIVATEEWDFARFPNHFSISAQIVEKLQHWCLDLQYGVFLQRGKYARFIVVRRGIAELLLPTEHNRDIKVYSSSTIFTYNSHSVRYKYAASTLPGF